MNPVFIYQSSVLLAAVSAILLPFATKYWELIVFSIAYGLSDGIFVATQCFILLSYVDAKRRTASFCITNLLDSLTTAAGPPIAGELSMNC